jgi:phage terminase small subunit
MPRASSALSAAQPTASTPTRGDNARSKAERHRKQESKSYLQARANGIDTGTYEAAESLDPNRALTEKQLAFVQLWAEGHTILMASVKAGYNDAGSCAYRMARMPHIVRRYQEEKVRYEEAAQMTRKKVMDMLKESYDTAKMVAEPSSMVAAAREIGKMCGYYEPVTIRHQHAVEGDVIHRRVERMNDQELLEYIAEQQRLISSSASGEPTAQLLPPRPEKKTRKAADVEDAHVKADE